MEQKGYYFMLVVKAGPYLNPWDNKTYQTGDVLRKTIAMDPPWYQPEKNPHTGELINRCTKEDIPHPWTMDYPTLPPELEVVLIDAETFPKDTCPVCGGSGEVVIIVLPTPCVNCQATGEKATLLKVYKDAFDNRKDILDELDDYEIDISHVNPSPDVPANCACRGLKKKQ